MIGMPDARGKKEGARPDWIGRPPLEGAEFVSASPYNHLPGDWQPTTQTPGAGR